MSNIHDGDQLERRDIADYQATPGGSIYVHASRMDWQPWRVPGATIKVLYEDSSKGELTCLLKFPAGTHIPAHEHPALEQTFVLSGQMQDHDGVATGGDFILRMPGSKHENHCPIETIVLAVYRKQNVLYEP